MTTSEETRTFLGMRIVGDRNGGEARVEQRPVEELSPLFRAVFVDGVIEAVRWAQYTPYFNDGDPCEFSVNADGLEVRLADRSFDEAEDLDEGWIETDSYGREYAVDRLIGSVKYPDGYRHWDESTHYLQPTYSGPHPGLIQAINELKTALGSGAFENVLLELFGDHATVTVPFSGDIEVETYDHD